MLALAARLIVCERSGTWARWLRRLPDNLALPLCEARTLQECHELLATAPASLAAIDLGVSDPATTLGTLARWSRLYPHARCVILAQYGWESFESAAREAGAVHFVASPRRLRPLASIVRRHAESLPRAELSPIERIWAELPWND